MKKKILLISSIAILSMSMAACGKEKEEPVIATSAAESETSLEIYLEGEINGFKLSGGSTQEATEESEPEETEPESSKDKKFECLPEIEEASIDSGKFQIDDMVFTIGAPAQEIFDALENSECEYEYDYTPNALIAKSAGVGVYLTFQKNGEDYFYIYVYNFADTTCELKECTILATQALASEASTYYSGNIAAGGSYDDITEKLADCKILEEYSDSIRQEYKVTYKITTQNEIIESHTMKQYDGYILELIFDSNTRILKYWNVRA